MNNHSSIAGLQSRNSAKFGSQPVQFRIACSPLQATPCLCIVQQKIVIGAGCTSSERYSCPVKFPSYVSFFLQNLQGFQNRPWDCTGFSQRSRRVSSERSIGRSRLNWNVLGSSWKLQAFRAGTVFRGVDLYTFGWALGPPPQS